jgi:hypothetical protein
MTPQRRGLPVSAEGITGSGKTDLIQRFLAEHEALQARAVERALASSGREESTGRAAAL